MTDRVIVRCPQCSLGLRLPAGRTGKVTCSGCGHSFRVDTRAPGRRSSEAAAAPRAAERLALRRLKGSTWVKKSRAAFFFGALAVLFGLAGMTLFIFSGLQLALYAGGLFAIPSLLLRRWQLRKTQPIRDMDAVGPGPVAVYLRPFVTDQQFQFRNPFRSNLALFSEAAVGVHGGQLLGVVEPRFVLAEQFVSQVLEYYVRLVQVGGGPGTVSGARLQASESDWRHLVVNATRGARFIVLFPLIAELNGELQGKSTLWEIEHLCSTEKMAKTGVLIPPALGQSKKELRARWRLTQQHAASKGLALPDYVETGGVSIFSRQEERWREARRFGESGPHKTRLAQGLLDAYAALGGTRLR